MNLNYLKFKRYVQKKFGGLDKFSKLMTGTTFGKYKGLEYLADTEPNYNLIEALHDAAKKMENDPSKTTVSDEDRKAIISRMDMIIEASPDPSDTEKYKSSHWLRKNKISQSYYSGVKGGRLDNKNQSYENLAEKLGIDL